MKRDSLNRSTSIINCVLRSFGVDLRILNGCSELILMSLLILLFLERGGERKGDDGESKLMRLKCVLNEFLIFLHHVKYL